MFFSITRINIIDMEITGLELTLLHPLLVAFVSGVIGPMVVMYVKHVLVVQRAKTLKKRNSDFKNTICVQQKINNAINTFQSKHGFDRVWVAQLHNGGHFFPSNVSMKKLSMTFESTKPGISTDIMKLQNLPVSFFSGIFENVNNTYKHFVVSSETVEDCALINFWNSRGILKSYIFPIICLESGLIGIFGIDLITENLDFDKKMLNVIEDEVKLLTGYISIVSFEPNK